MDVNSPLKRSRLKVWELLEAGRPKVLEQGGETGKCRWMHMCIWGFGLSVGS